MNNIDILEEFIEAYRIAEEVLDGEIIEAIKTLIAENKELKEKNKELEEEDVKIRAKFILKLYDYIPKSKVEEEIHYLKECKDFAKTGKFKEAQIQTELLEAVIKKLEQSLLGKE